MDHHIFQESSTSPSVIIPTIFSFFKTAVAPSILLDISFIASLNLELILTSGLFSKFIKSPVVVVSFFREFQLGGILKIFHQTHLML